MGGGLLSIVSYGVNELYLTGSPEITFFKLMYRRHTNFSSESVALFIGSLNLGDKIEVPIPMIGDLIHKTYIQLELPSILLKRSDVATDLTPYEEEIINTPNTYPNESDINQIYLFNLSEKYQIIKDFMKINMNGFRKASARRNIRNQTVETYINEIKSVLVYPDDLKDKYSDALNLASQYEQNIRGNIKNNLILDSNMSDISDMLDLLVLNPITQGYKTYDDFTIEDIYKIIKRTTDISIKTKEYFFNKVKENFIKKEEMESLYLNFAWIHRLGHYIFEYIDVLIGGEKIDRHYNDFINLWYELTGSYEQQYTYNRMIGDIKELTSYDKNIKPSHLITLPLSFWFSRYVGLAFPLVSMPYSPFTLVFKLNKFENLAYVERVSDSLQDSLNINELTLSDVWDNMGLSINATLLIDYIYLDTLERKRFAQSALEYLIETVNPRVVKRNIENNRQDIQLDFNGPTREMFWFATKDIYNNNDSNLIKMPYNYSYNSNSKNNPIRSSQLILNSYVLFSDRFDNKYYNYVQPYSHNTKSPCDGLNVYSFALYPEEHQPSSSCNFSRFIEPVLKLNIDDKMFKYKVSDIDPNIPEDSELNIELDTSITIKVYSIRFDILRLIGGMGGLAFK